MDGRKKRLTNDVLRPASQELPSKQRKNPRTSNVKTLNAKNGHEVKCLASSIAIPDYDVTRGRPRISIDPPLGNTKGARAAWESLSSCYNSLTNPNQPIVSLPAFSPSFVQDVASSEHLGQLLQKIQGNENQVKPESLIGILEFATSHKMRGLRKQVVAAMVATLDGSNCCEIFAAAHRFCSAKLRKAALNHIISNFEAACQTDYFHSLEAPLVIEILKNISQTDQPTAIASIKKWITHSQPIHRGMEIFLRRCIQIYPEEEGASPSLPQPSILDIGSTYNANYLHAAISSASVFYNPGRSNYAEGISNSQSNEFKLNRMKKLDGHSGHVMSLTIYHSFLISGGTEGIKVWDAQTWQCRRTLGGHHGAVLSLAVNSDKLFSGSRDCTIKIWDMKKWECLGTLIKHADAVHSIMICGKCLLSASSDGRIVIWDTTSWMVVKVLEGHCGGVKALAGIENIILSGSFDHTIRVWGLKEGRCIRSLCGHESGITSLAILSENTKFASGSNDDTVKIWEMYTWNCIVTLRGHSDTVWTIAEIKGKLLSGSADRTIKVWNMESWQCEDTLDAHERSVSKLYVFKKFVISCSWDHSIMLWDTHTSALDKI